MEARRHDALRRIEDQIAEDGVPSTERFDVREMRAFEIRNGEGISECFILTLERIAIDCGFELSSGLAFVTLPFEAHPHGRGGGVEQAPAGRGFG